MDPRTQNAEEVIARISKHAADLSDERDRLRDHAAAQARELKRFREINAELLAALVDIQTTCDPAEGNAKAQERAYDSFQIARAAIARAKGEDR